ncbi:lachesin-like [Ostrea edulis]|uniref:lachesin-like n=1 Tax=Ostrea edulis TaxID=37623 RepID=UPI0024AE9B7A|nr:lachesin-like [Ostrea edulis]
MLFIVAIILLGPQHQVGAKKPEIVGDILPDIKKGHETGYLNCTVINKGPGQKVLWIYVGSPEIHPTTFISEDDSVYEGIQSKYDIQVTRDEMKTTYMLVVRNLDFVDGGDYNCVISIPGLDRNKWPTKTGTLVVHVPPSITPGRISFYEQMIGSNLTLNCEAFGVPSPNITWRREDRKELPNGGFQIQGGQLNLRNLQRDDRGAYTCVAENGINPPDSWKVQIRVFCPPICTPVQSVVGQAQNRLFNAKLTCIVKGYPQPTVTWMKDSADGNRALIQNDDHYRMTKHYISLFHEEEVWHSLTVNNVQASDYGKYYCVGKNRYGEGKTTFTLFETLECQGAKCPTIKGDA